MRSLNLRPFVAVLLGIAIATDALATQESIDEIRVTATRRAVNAFDVSAGLTLIDGETVRSRKLVTDALANTVGVFLQQTTPGQGAAIIRGQRGSSVLHLVDGLRLNNTIFRSAPTQYLSLVPAGAIERIEVVRGTPASLYGSDAVGGVVQLVTRVPRFDSDAVEHRGAARVGFESAELGRIVRATVDAGTKRLATSLSAEYLRSGNRRTGSGERIAPSGFTSKALRWALAATPSASRSWLVDLHFAEQPRTPRIDELVPGFSQSEPSSSEFLFAPNRRSYLRTAYRHENGPLGFDWHINFGWQRIDDDRISRDFAATERTLEQNRSDLFGLVASAGGSIGDGSWIAGLESYVDVVTSHRAIQDIVDGGVRETTPRFPDGAEVRRHALFGNVERPVTERQRLNGGLRVSHERVSLPTTAVSDGASVRVTDLSGDIGWLMNLSDHWQIAANAGFGFRAPNVFDLGTLGNRPGNRFNIPNTDLDSERVVQTDLGLRYRSDRIRIEAMLFSMRYDDRITSVATGATSPDGRTIVQSVNAAKSRVHGIETGALFELGNALELEALLNYSRGNQTFVGQSDEPADRMPPLNGSITVRYEANPDVGFDAWLRYAARQDRLSARDIGDVRIDPAGTAGWGILGLRVRWHRDDSWHVMAGIDNLLDKPYRNHGSGLDATGRNLFVNLQRRW